MEIYIALLFLFFLKINTLAEENKYLLTQLTYILLSNASVISLVFSIFLWTCPNIVLTDTYST